MQLLQIGFSHKTAPAPVRETLARLAPERLLAAYLEAGWPQTVALSTCNRFEVYLWGRAAAMGPPALSGGRSPLLEGAAASQSSAVRLLERLAGCGLEACAQARRAEAAVLHLFEVAAGLDSLVVGETEILGQVKTAYERARACGLTGKHLNVLFQRALYVGKRVRRCTAIAAGQTSVAAVAVQLAEAIFGELTESLVLVVGAGQVAEQACRHFLCRKVKGLTIVNRTSERAEALAASLAGWPSVRVRPWAGLAPALAAADVVLAATGAGRPVITGELVSAARSARSGRSLFLIDVAMPRDVEEAVHGLDGVYLYRLEDLERIVAENIRSRQGEIEKARLFVRQKAAEFCAWADSVSRGRERSLSHCD